MTVSGNLTVIAPKDFLKALDTFEKSQKKKTRQAAPDVCATYALVKPILTGILPFLNFIPSIGPRIVAAVSARLRPAAIERWKGWRTPR